MPKKKPTRKPATKHDVYTTQRIRERKHYARLWTAAAQTLAMLKAMEEAGAIRLPFHGFDATVVNLREVLKAPE